MAPGRIVLRCRKNGESVIVQVENANVNISRPCPIFLQYNTGSVALLKSLVSQ